MFSPPDNFHYYFDLKKPMGAPNGKTDGRTDRHMEITPVSADLRLRPKNISDPGPSSFSVGNSWDLWKYLDGFAFALNNISK